MRLHFVKASPCRNTTVFLEGNIPKKAYAALGRLAMDADYLAAEQAGFLTEPKNPSARLRLEMAGGEFCGNAVLALGALVLKRGLSEDGSSFLLECSGAERPLRCRVKAGDSGHYESCSEMPSALSMRPFTLRAGGSELSGGLAELPGIVHFCAEAKSLSGELYDALMHALEDSVESSAFGIIAYERLGAAEYRIRPYVSVPSAHSRVFEQACGSGSLALGLWLKRQGREDRICVRQPGGALTVDVSGEAPLIAADVYFPCEGEMWAEDALFAERDN